MKSAGQRNKRRAPLPPFQVQRMVHLFTVQRLSMEAIGWLYGKRTAKQVRQILWQAGVRMNESGSGVRIPDEKVAAMHADYMTGMKLVEVARKHGRTGRAISEIFRRRGLPVREYHGPQCHKADGTFEAAPPLTEAEIQAMIDEATDIAIPPGLRLEWRKWSLERRADFVARLRARLGQPLPDPALFSANVEFFAYGWPRAHALMDRINEVTDSRTFRVKINLKSWGVIYDDLLWTRSPRVGFVQGPWLPDGGRPVLHQVIFRKHHGPIPAGHVIRHADGNPFNLEPGNLVLATRNDLARENQAKALFRKSRERTALIFNRSQQDHDPHDTFERLRRAAR